MSNWVEFEIIVELILLGTEEDKQMSESGTRMNLVSFLQPIVWFFLNTNQYFYFDLSELFKCIMVSFLTPSLIIRVKLKQSSQILNV